VKICLISVEIFAWGKFGGFGRATRLIGRELVKRGYEVFAVVPRRLDQKQVEDLDGITVLGFDPNKPWTARKLFREANADIYHSCEPSLGTYFAMKEMPQKKHMVTFRDPRDLKDWIMEFQLPSLNRLQVIHNWLYESNPLVHRAIKKMDAVYTATNELVAKVQSMHKLNVVPQFLPTPVDIPQHIQKADKPTVCYLARLDRRKRPMIFLELAKKFSQVDFIMMGKSRNQKWEKSLKREAQNIPNVEMLGHINQFTSNLHSEVLSKSWVMVNPAAREGLPNSFIEAASYQCALLSSVNPDDFSSNFGYYAKEDDFEAGLHYLLKDDNWKTHGLRGYEHIKETFELNKSIDRHIKIYEGLVQNKNLVTEKITVS